MKRLLFVTLALLVAVAVQAYAAKVLYRWVVNHDPKLIYRVVATTGSTVNSFPAPGTYPYGIAFRDPSYIYYTSYDDRLLYFMHATTGSIYASYPVPSPSSGLAYDPAGYLWTGDRFTSSRVWKLTLTGAPIASFSVRAYGKVAGLGYGGGYVWVGFSYPIHVIVQFTASGNPVSKFSPPGDHAVGVAFLSNKLYIDTRAPDWCWETTTTGTVISSFKPPGPSTMGTAVGSMVVPGVTPASLGRVRALFR